MKQEFYYASNIVLLLCLLVLLLWVFSTVFSTMGHYNAATNRTAAAEVAGKKGDDYDEQISNIVDYYTRYIAIYILYKGINEIKKVNGAEDNRKT